MKILNSELHVLRLRVYNGNNNILITILQVKGYKGALDLHISIKLKMQS